MGYCEKERDSKASCKGGRVMRKIIVLALLLGFAMAVLVSAEIESTVTRYLAFNVTQPPVDNPLVRQAIAYAVDRYAICHFVFEDTLFPLFTMVPADAFPYCSIDVFPYHDLEMARKLLAKAGYHAGNRLELNLWYTPKHYGTFEADVATVLKGSLEQTGVINITLKALDWGAYVERMSSGGFDMFLLGWDPDNLDGYSFLAPWTIESPEFLGTYFNHHPNYEAYRRILDVARCSSDWEKEGELYEAIQMLWAYDVPVIPLAGRIWQSLTDTSGQFRAPLGQPTAVYKGECVDSDFRAIFTIRNVWDDNIEDLEIIIDDNFYTNWKRAELDKPYIAKDSIALRSRDNGTDVRGVFSIVIEVDASQDYLSNPRPAPSSNVDYDLKKESACQQVATYEWTEILLTTIHNRGGYVDVEELRHCDGFGNAGFGQMNLNHIAPDTDFFFVQEDYCASNNLGGTVTVCAEENQAEGNVDRDKWTIAGKCVYPD
jgi:hypothetical protein